MIVDGGTGLEPGQAPQSFDIRPNDLEYREQYRVLVPLGFLGGPALLVLAIVSVILGRLPFGWWFLGVLVAGGAGLTFVGSDFVTRRPATAIEVYPTEVVVRHENGASRMFRLTGAGVGLNVLDYRYQEGPGSRIPCLLTSPSILGLPGGAIRLPWGISGDACDAIVSAAKAGGLDVGLKFVSGGGVHVWRIRSRSSG